MTGTGFQVYELTVCAASGFKTSIGGLMKSPKFFLTVQDGNATLLRTATSERSLTPEWNTSHNLVVSPNQHLKFELFRDSSLRSTRSVGSFETTMAQFEQLQVAEKVITQSVTDDVALTFRCRKIDVGPIVESASQAQTVREPEPAPEASAAVERQTLPSSRGPHIALDSRPQSKLNIAPESPLPATQIYGSGLRTFALIIGIDEYTSNNKPRLQGATNDARNMHQLLRISFGVPDAHIILLYNQDATRARILKEFSALATNRNIQKGDAIIIYFAGHGSRAPAPPEWRVAEGEVETLCPVDEEFIGGPSEIHGIPDRTIGALVHTLSAAKGENITLIFDCCHSGGIARGDEPGQLWRAAETTVQLPADLDRDIWGHLPLARGGSRKAAFLPSLSNYVLLAACQPHERAMETIIDGKSYGAFSTILIRHLRRSGSTTTYSELLRKVAGELDSPTQNPICEGEKKTRPIFDGLASGKEVKLFTVEATGQGTYSVDLGTIHGITDDCRFGLRRFDPDSGALVSGGTLEVQKVLVGSSTLQFAAGGTAGAFAATNDCMVVIEGWGTSEHIINVNSTAMPNRWMEPPIHLPRYRTNSTRSRGTLTLHEVDSNRMFLERDFPAFEYMKQLLPPISFTPSTLQSTLNATTDFHFHLTRDNPSVSAALHDKVKLGIHRLSGGIKSPNLFSSDGRVTVTPEMDFFFTITNESPHNIFPYLFYFDPTDYSIQDWYSPPQDNGQAPLHAGQQGSPTTLMVGFNDQSFEFTIPDGATRDLGFVKLFVSTCQVNMESLVQESPFLTPRAAGPAGAARGGKMKRGQRIPDTWDACCYTVNIRLPA